MPAEARDALQGEWKALNDYHQQIPDSLRSFEAAMSQFEAENPIEQNPILHDAGFLPRHEKIVADGIELSVLGLGETIDAALEDATRNLPSGVHVLRRRVCSEAQQKIVTMESQIAEAADGLFLSTKGFTPFAKVTSVRKVAVGKSRFLGLMKDADLFEVEVLDPVQVEITYVVRPNDPCVCGSGRKVKLCCGRG